MTASNPEAACECAAITTKCQGERASASYGRSQTSARTRQVTCLKTLNFLSLLQAASAFDAAGTRQENPLRSTMQDEDGSYLVISMELPVPVTTAYLAWLRYKNAPCFMKGVEQSDNFDGAGMTWCVLTPLEQFAWQAKTCARVPYERIEWKSTEGMPHPNFGSVSFEDLGENRSRIMICIGFDLAGIYHPLKDPVPSLAQTMERSLRCFDPSTFC